MRTVFDEEEDVAEPEIDREEGQDRELTISSTTLLAIFFGLVLVCGFFFALGYSLGRRSAPEAVTSETAASTSAAHPSDSIAKPSAGDINSAATPATAEAQPTDGSDDGSSSPQTDATPQSAVKPAIIPAATTPAPQPKPVVIAKTSQPAESKPTVKPALPETTTSQPTLQPVASTGSGIMVQIAAISNPSDARVLIDALKKHGFNAVPRREPNDSLIHVQVGPFANRSDAIVMRQKLLSEGYNAILK